MCGFVQWARLKGDYAWAIIEPTGGLQTHANQRDAWVLRHIPHHTPAGVVYLLRGSLGASCLPSNRVSMIQTYTAAVSTTLDEANFGEGSVGH